MSNHLIKTEAFNFKELVNTNLSITLQSKFVEKLKERFDDEELKIYILNLYGYLNFHPTNDYPIDLEDIIEFVGFSHKRNAKRMLENNFVEDEDYKRVDTLKNVQKDQDIKGGQVLLPREQNLNQDVKGRDLLLPREKQVLERNLGGRPTEKIMLNMDCFKQLCMLVKSEKSKKIKKPNRTKTKKSHNIQP